MTLKDCYAKLEGDYAGVTARLIREASISKFLIMFLKDTQFNEFHQAYASSDWENAFRTIHTLKGTSLNLGLSLLASIASDITELLRNGAPTVDISQLVRQLDAEYERTISVIREYSENPEI